MKPERWALVSFTDWPQKVLRKVAGEEGDQAKRHPRVIVTQFTDNGCSLQHVAIAL